MTQAKWMIYGANGYSGSLIAKEATRKNETPILAGRSDSVIPLAKALGLEHRVFSLSNPETIRQNLSDIKLVLNCAGPFTETWEPLVNACLATTTHYLDITGEIEVFEGIHTKLAEAKKAKSAFIPGVGFDVVPSDCLAASLSKKLPDADQLELAFMGADRVSRGTLRTMLQNIPKGSKVRRDGKIQSIPFFSKSKELNLSGKALQVTAIPWGDVSTAFYSTKIPNITVYTPTPRLIRKLKPMPTKALLKVLSAPLMQSLLDRLAARFVRGPSEEDRKSGHVLLWGKVSNRKGKSFEATLRTPEGYTFTVISALECVRRVLTGEITPGFQTPSLAFGSDFIHEIHLGDTKTAEETRSTTNVA